MLTFAKPAKRPEEARQAEQRVKSWVENALPADFAGETVMVAEILCNKPECPLETTITVLIPKAKVLKVPKPIAEVTQQEVLSLLQGWEETRKRSKPVQAWAEQALPQDVAGCSVVVEETEDNNPNIPFETVITVLSSPKHRTMKVLKQLSDVTQDDVQRLMAISQLNPNGISSVR